MKYLAVVCAIGFVSTIHAQTPSKSAVIVLHEKRSEIKWNASSAMVGDFDCDGKPDTVVLGAQGNKVAVGVVWGNRVKNPDVFNFSVSGARQGAFCAMPKRVEVYAHDCDSGNGMLPGCKSSRSCKDFAVVDDACDSFNFYWDVEHKQLAWWRR